MAEPKTLPLEGHVAHLFAFCLGVVTGMNSFKALESGQLVGAEDLPQGYSLVGGALDEAAGDAVLSSEGSWYLIEMKRGYPQLRDEFKKPRVKNLHEYLRGQAGWKDKPLLNAARSGHQFLYLCRMAGSTAPELVTLGYLDWLVDSVPHRAAEWKSKSIRFVEFLLKKPMLKGFTFEQLAEYVFFMDGEKGTKSSAGDWSLRLALVLDTTGAATLVTREQLRPLLEPRLIAIKARQAAKTSPPAKAKDRSI